MFTPHKPKR